MVPPDVGPSRSDLAPPGAAPPACGTPGGAPAAPHRRPACRACSRRPSRHHGLTLRRGPPPASPGLGRFGRGTALLVIGIVALAFNLRAAITSLPPVFPELSASLRLSSAALAVLA